MEQEPKQNQSEEKTPTYVQGDMFVEAEKEQKRKEEERWKKQEEEFKKHWDSKFSFSDEELKELHSKQEYYKGQD